MIYIRTADKISQPFTIPLWSKILATLFACYFVWITVEYVKMVSMESEIARLEVTTAAKYELIARLEDTKVVLDEAIKNQDLVIETARRMYTDELSAIH
jgi:hypothetical protein